MLTNIKLQGNWKVSVTGRVAAWDQRILVTGSAAGDGAYPGHKNAPPFDVLGDDFEPWTLSIENNDGGGWKPSEIKKKPPVNRGSPRKFVIESRDRPWIGGEPFDDLVLQADADEVRIIEVPVRPYAVRTDTLQMTPEGIFETMLGSCYLYARVKNIWSGSLPADSSVRISNKSELSTGGIQVIDYWSAEELETLGQKATGEWVELGALAPGESRHVYFKLDCKSAQPRKYTVEFELKQPCQPEPNATALKFTAEQKIFVSRSGYNSLKGEFFSECDQGKLFVHFSKALVEYTSLRDMVRCARDHISRYGPPLQDRARKILQDLLDGNPVDLCELKRLLDSACEDTRQRQPCGDLFIIPTAFEYRVEPNPAYAGKFGPLPFDDPFWKALLALIALLFSLATGLSAISDLAYQSDNTVIGKLYESTLEEETSGPYQGFFLVDAALCKLNSSRPLPTVIPPLQLLDAQSDEEFKVPVEQMDGTITLDGEYMTNAEIKNLIQKYKANPHSLSAIENVRVFKSGGRTGLTHALMEDVIPQYERMDDDGVLRIFKDQLTLRPIPPDILPDPQTGKPPHPAANQAIGRAGDSGSLWVHWKTRKIVALNHGGSEDDSGKDAGANRIEDVIKKLGITFK